MKKKISILTLSLMFIIALTNCKSEKEPVVNSITISPTNVSVFEGEKVSFITNVTTNTIEAKSPTVYWKTDDENVATIKKGIMTAQKGGNTTITASSGGRYATCSVDVKVYIPATSLTLNKENLELNVGEKFTLLFVITPSNSSLKIPFWKISDEEIISIGKYGEITALKEGKATITAFVDELEATCEVTVK